MHIIAPDPEGTVVATILGMLAWVPISAISRTSRT
jgi:hypothetical protein